VKSVAHLQPRRARWLMLPVVGLLVWWLGRAVASEGPRRGTAMMVATVALGIPVAWALLGKRVGRGALALEAPLLLLVFSTLVFRGRSAEDLAVNPLDPAAQLRVAAVLIAGLLGMFAFLSGRQAGIRLTTLPFRLYALYAVVVFAGAPLSVNPTLTAYRGVELAAGLMVLVGARQSLGERAVPRIEATLYWSAVALLASVWFGVLAFPKEAIKDFAAPGVPVNFQIQGVYPSISANGVGTLGVILVAWSIGRIRRPESPGLRPGIAYLVAAIALVSLLAAQYRTGYVALVATGLVFLIARRKVGQAVVLAGAVTSLVILAPSFLSEAEPYVLRGQTPERAQELSGRVEFWDNAIPVWETSPLIGRGLLTATRFEVLSPLGLSFTSGIHGTWIEALVGTGIIGVALLGASFLVSFGRAIPLARHGGRLAPLLLLTVIAVRSFTGATFESFSHIALIYLWIALSLDDRRPNHRAPEPSGNETAENFEGSSALRR
jgi:O-antigen ligase